MSLSAGSILAGLPLAGTDLGESAPAPLQLRVNDLKQWLYCQRIVFYHCAMPVPVRSTWKMEEGHNVQRCLERLEKRRGFARYGLDQALRHFDAWLASERLGLTGKLDLLLETPERMFPVDFKFSAQQPYPNHRLQLAGYALLVEERWQRPVDVGFIYLTPRHQVVEIQLDSALKQQALDCLDQIRAMIAAERMPEPTPVRRRCDDCEFRNYCADIF